MASVREMIMLIERRLASTLKISDERKTEHLQPLPTTPTKLLDLPNELLFLIFFHCEAFKSGVALSATSQRLHHIWLSDKNRITFRLLQRSLPLFDVALQLAIDEIRITEPERDLSIDTVFSRKDLDDIIPIIRRNYEISKRIWDKRYASYTGKYSRPRRPLVFTQVLELFYIICDHIILNRDAPYNQGEWLLPSYAKSTVLSWELLEDLEDLMSSVMVAMRGEHEMSIYGQRDLPSWLTEKAWSRVWLLVDRLISD